MVSQNREERLVFALLLVFLLVFLLVVAKIVYIVKVVGDQRSQVDKSRWVDTLGRIWLPDYKSRVQFGRFDFSQSES